MFYRQIGWITVAQRGTFHNEWTTRSETGKNSQKNIPQSPIARNFGISPSATHKLIKRFDESPHIPDKDEQT